MSWSPCPDPELGDRATAEAIKTIKPGAVNWMRAGRGIVHSERTAVGRRRNGQRLFGIQTWMALPEDREEDDAALPWTEAPMRESGKLGTRTLAGPKGDRQPSQNELTIARFQGRHVAEIAAKLAR